MKRPRAAPAAVVDTGHRKAAPTARRDLLAVDTDVLVNWAIRGAPHHEAARAFLRQQVESDVVLVLTQQVVAEFIHVVTDGRRFERPLPMSEALQLTRELMASKSVVVLSPPARATARMVELLEEWNLGRKRILDTFLAASLEACGVRCLVTLNSKDFQLFKFLELVPIPDGE